MGHSLPPARFGRALAVDIRGVFRAVLIRFLVPVGQADNRDGPRLTCGLGMGRRQPCPAVGTWINVGVPLFLC
jgi:hypothetical protein